MTTSFLGEVHFEELPGGRVRCVETGHEMPLAQKEGYGLSKKCRRALFDRCLASRKPPLNVFEQSSTCKDKVVCTLTGDVLNKSEEALWKHMNGKKFQRKLAQKEAERKAVSRQTAENVMAEVITDSIPLSNGQYCGASDHSPHGEGAEGGNMDCDDEPKFWVPPADYEGDGFCEDVPTRGEGQSCEVELRTIQDASPMGIKRKAKKAPPQPALRKKKGKPHGIQRS